MLVFLADGAGGAEQRMVTLLSPDKQTFQVPWDVAMRSTVVKQMLEGTAPFSQHPTRVDRQESTAFVKMHRGSLVSG